MEKTIRTTKHELKRLSLLARRLPLPIVSAYVPFAAGIGDQKREAVTRTHAALLARGIPAPMRERVERVVTDVELSTGTLVVFASDDSIVHSWLEEPIPLDGRTGTAYVRWGEPDLTPLSYLMQRRTRAAVLYADRDHFRLFDASINTIDEVSTHTRPPSEMANDTLQQSKQIHPAYIASRAGSARDDAASHRDELVNRFLRDCISDLSIIFPPDVDLVVMGSDFIAGKIEALLPQDLTSRIVARVPGLSSPNAAPSEVHERVVSLLVDLQHQREQASIKAALRSDVIGVAQTLRELQRGRLGTVVTAWPIPDVELFQEWATGTIEIHEQSGGLITQPTKLALTLPLLCTDFGATLEFVSGELKDRMTTEFDGVVGIRRW